MLYELSPSQGHLSAEGQPGVTESTDRVRDA
jgi:hypothetical protein